MSEQKQTSLEEHKELIHYAAWIKECVDSQRADVKAQRTANFIMAWVLIGASLVGGVWLLAFLMKGLLTFLGIIR